jgi:hypothetical protein
VGPDRYGFELGGHVSNVAGDVKRIVGSSPRSRRNALSGSPIPGFVSREAYFLGHPIKLSHSAERGRRRCFPARRKMTLLDTRVATIRLVPRLHPMRHPFPTQNKSLSTIFPRRASTIMLRKPAKPSVRAREIPVQYPPEPARSSHPTS